MKTLSIRIDPTGATTIDVSGFVGNECEKATRPIEDEIGVVEKREKKGEYFKQKTVGTNQVRGG